MSALFEFQALWVRDIYNAGLMHSECDLMRARPVTRGYRATFPPRKIFATTGKMC